MMTRTRLVGAAFLCLLGACTVPAGTSQATPAGQSRSVLTHAQLAATNSDNLFDAINKLHSEWLSTRGPTSVTDSSPTSVSIFMGGTMLGKAEALREVPVIDVAEVRYWDAGQAAARFGMGHPRGVIEITRK
jgi:hypothetical protein